MSSLSMEIFGFKMAQYGLYNMNYKMSNQEFWLKTYAFVLETC